MEKRSPYILVLFVSIALLSSGCSDSFYDQLAGDRITPVELIKLKTVPFTCFGWCNGATAELVYARMYNAETVLRTDQMDVTDFSDSYFRAINDQNFSVDNPYIDGSDLYKIIINCNEILANIDRTAERDRNIDAFILPLLFKGRRNWP